MIHLFDILEVDENTSSIQRKYVADADISMDISTPIQMTNGY